MRVKKHRKLRFFEASSIRKFKGKYYLVYSSVALHELCYAVSEKPDRDFRFGGVLISNGDKFAGDPKGVIMTAYGNNHGGLEEIDGRYYIFYHRPTNRSMYSRQGWCEEIFMDESGHFAQVEMTSGGLNGGPLPGEGTYPAACAVHLRGKRNPSWSLAEFMAEDDPYITQDGEDFSPEEADIRETGTREAGTREADIREASTREAATREADIRETGTREADTKEADIREASTREAPRQYIRNCCDGLKALYRYFEGRNRRGIAVTVRGNAEGILRISWEKAEKAAGEIALKPSAEWECFEGDFALPEGVHSITFSYIGQGSFDFLEFSL